MPRHFVGALLVGLLCSPLALAHSNGDDHHHHHGAQGHRHNEQHHSQESFEQFANLPPVPNTVVVENCWVRAMPAPLPSAGYLELHNRGHDPVALVAAQAAPFEATMLHATVDKGGMASMEHVSRLEVADGESASLAPGGYHLMFEQPQQDLVVGEQLPVQLRFEGYAPREVSCEIRSARGEPGH